MRARQIEALSRSEVAKEERAIRTYFKIRGLELNENQISYLRTALQNLYLTGWYDAIEVAHIEREGKEVAAKGPDGFVTV